MYDKNVNSPACADALNVLLADRFALYLKTKNYHWHVQGPRFRELHLLFDEQAAQIFATTDPIAERVRKNGAPTLRSIGDIGRRTSLRDDERAGAAGAQMIRSLAGEGRTHAENGDNGARRRGSGGSVD